MSGSLAHTGAPIGPHDLWSAWSAPPSITVALLGAALLYRSGWARPVGRSGRHGALRSSGARSRRRAFGAALVTLALALLSPLDAASSSLASAHMVQHVLLVLVAAPLLAWSSPGATLRRGLPPGARRTVRRVASLPGVAAAAASPSAAWLTHVVALWFWHAAAPYDAAVVDGALHAVEHATFVLSAVWFWSTVVGPAHGERRNPAVGLVLVFAMALQSVFLSALLTFAPTAWYGVYAHTTAAWGLTPLADQQLAGVIMWVPAGAVHLGVGLLLLQRWIAPVDDAAPGDAHRASFGRRAT